MKIKNINIAAFGKLKNFSLDFSDGFNVIYGKNEAGKTTVMAFIKMMFYGSEKGSGQIAKNARKKYLPWSGEKMAGSIDFEENGRNFRLERVFGATNTSDKVYLTDLDMGEKQAVVPDVGTKIFGVSAPTFERSLFIGIPYFEAGNATAEGELNAKLSNLAKTGDEDVSFERVKANIEKPYFALHSRSGKTGIYDKNKAELESVNLKILKSSEEKNRISALKTTGGEIKKALAELTEKLSGMKTVIAKENDIKNAGKLREYLDTKQNLDKQNTELSLTDGNFADSGFISTVKFAVSRYNTTKTNLDLAQKNADALKANEVDVEKLKATATPENKQNAERDLRDAKAENTSLKNTLESIKSSTVESSKSPVALWLASAVALLIGVAIFYFLKSAASLALIGIALICAVSGLVLKKSLTVKANAEKERAIKNAESDILLNEAKIAQAKTALNVVISALETNENIIKNRKAALSNAEESVEKAKIDFEKAQSELIEHYAKYKRLNSPDEITADLSGLEEKTQEKKLLTTTLGILARDLGGISYEEAAQKLEKISADTVGLPENTEQIKAEYDLLSEKSKTLYGKLAEINAEIKAYEKSTGALSELPTQKQMLEEKIANEEFFISSAETALEVLSQSFAEIRRGFGGILEEKTGEIFSGLTGGKYTGATVSKSFEIGAKSDDEFGAKETDYLSSGALSQAFLSLRLAVAKLISGENTLPVFLDDPFVFYDNERTGYGNNYLKEYSKSGQIILFTCRREELESAADKGADTVCM